MAKLKAGTYKCPPNLGWVGGVPGREMQMHGWDPLPLRTEKNFLGFGLDSSGLERTRLDHPES